MSKDWIKADALFGQPGSEPALEKAGISRSCRLDTGADVSVVDESLVEEIYTGIGYDYRIVKVQTISSESMHRMVPVVIGLRDTKGSLVTAQVECLVVSGGLGSPLLGSDVLSHLGLAVTVDYKEKRVTLDPYNWASFEDEVAGLYRKLGARVRQNINLAGFQIDLVAEEQTASKQILRLAVECKYYRERVGNRVVNDFSRVVKTLKDSGLVDRGVLVSHAGFTKDASLVAGESGVELLTIEDLRQAVNTAQSTPVSTEAESPKEGASKGTKNAADEEAPATRVSTFFVVMPFLPELDDVYHFGIRAVVRDLGGSCERADEMQYTGGVMEKIYASIREADAVIAEVSAPNPNVYYEIGFAHALGKPVVLVTRDIEGTPFDLRAYNHVLYSSIVDLQKRLKVLLQKYIKEEN